ncbi:MULTISPECIES: terminase small subunit [Butyricimonas]|uniref:terminase small subunit n=1 Tax=Butyricimonas TaxID=574697 RepID=UPI0007FB2515|nr:MULTISPECIES: terminase small subunit [Butyricimonas]
MLTPKQEAFCNYYMETGNASEAYRRAFCCKKMSEKTIWEKASVLLSKGKVRTRVRELQDEQRSKSDITKDKILKELSNIAFSSISEMHNTWIERKEFEKLTPEQKSTIKSISTKVLKKNIGTHDDPEIVDVEYVKIELHDKLKAIERICKMLGFDAPEKEEVSVSFAKPLSREDRERIEEELEKDY